MSVAYPALVYGMRVHWEKTSGNIIFVSKPALLKTYDAERQIFIV